MRVKLSYHHEQLCQPTQLSPVTGPLRSPESLSESRQSYSQDASGWVNDASGRTRSRNKKLQPLSLPSSQRRDRSSIQDILPPARANHQIETSTPSTKATSRQTRSSARISSTSQNRASLRQRAASYFEANKTNGGSFSEHFATPSLESSGASLSPEIPSTADIDLSRSGRHPWSVNSTSMVPPRPMDSACNFHPCTLKQKSRVPTKVEKSSEGFVVVGSNWYATTPSPVSTVADLRRLLYDIESRAPDNLSTGLQPLQHEAIISESKLTSEARMSNDLEQSSVCILNTSPDPPSTRLSAAASDTALDTPRRSSARQPKLSAKQKEAEDMHLLVPARKRATTVEAKNVKQSTQSERSTPNADAETSSSGLRIRLKRPQVSLKLHLSRSDGLSALVASDSEVATDHEPSPLGPRKKRKPARFEGQA